MAAEQLPSISRRVSVSARTMKMGSDLFDFLCGPNKEDPGGLAAGVFEVHLFRESENELQSEL